MGYMDVTSKDAVVEAIREFDTFSETQDFLSLYGYGVAQVYVLRFEGRSYPPKAILGVAHRYQFPELGPLKNSDFSGGEAGANKVLRGLGFEIEQQSLLDEKDELFAQIRKISRGNVSSFGKAPHKPLLLLLAVQKLARGEQRLLAIDDWTRSLQPLLECVLPDRETSPLQPIWKLESALWTVELGGKEVRKSVSDEVDVSLLSQIGVVAGFSEQTASIITRAKCFEEIVEFIISEFLSEIHEDLKQYLRKLNVSSGIWWVNQGTTYEDAKNSGHVWAPLVQKNGIPASHHAILEELRVGDLVIHYAKGEVRALGQVLSEAEVTSRPFHHPEKGWEGEGRQVAVHYFELAESISLDEIKRRPSGVGPFNKNGEVNQGYMYRLPVSWALDCKNQFRDRWPVNSPWGTDSFTPLLSNRMTDLARWLLKFRQIEDFKSKEIDFKIELSLDLHQTLISLDFSSLSWIDSLLDVLSKKNNLINFRVRTGFRNQCESDPSGAATLLKQLMDGTNNQTEWIDAFSNWNTANSGHGTKLSLVSVLISALDVYNSPAINHTSTKRVHELIRRHHSQGSASERYFEYFALLDELMEICSGIRLETEQGIENRLEMQAAIWLLIAGIPHVSWSKETQTEYLSFMDGENMPNELQDLADELSLNVSFLHEIQELLEDKRQVIFYGPPGAGKTYVALKLAEALSNESEDSESVEIVQFHPSYAYEDFVEGFRPTESGSFVLKEGKLLSIARKALDNPGQKFYLIIDEINRGNIAKIFGEMYFLLEYRDRNIQLQYSNSEFKMPKNLYFIGTMNSADRSIGLIDTTLRRRFHFVSFYPTQDEMKDVLRDWLEKNAPEVRWVADLVDDANRMLNNPDFAIGPSHFMKPNLDEALVRKIWRRSIIPYVEDVFFNRKDEVIKYELDTVLLDRVRTLKRFAAEIEAKEFEEDDNAASA